MAKSSFLRKGILRFFDVKAFSTANGNRQSDVRELAAVFSRVYEHVITIVWQKSRDVEHFDRQFGPQLIAPFLDHLDCQTPGIHEFGGLRSSLTSVVQGARMWVTE
jgi:hypothetical protein